MATASSTAVYNCDEVGGAAGLLACIHTFYSTSSHEARKDAEAALNTLIHSDKCIANCLSIVEASECGVVETTFCSQTLCRRLQKSCGSLSAECLQDVLSRLNLLLCNQTPPLQLPRSVLSSLAMATAACTLQLHGKGILAIHQTARSLLDFCRSCECVTARENCLNIISEVVRYCTSVPISLNPTRKKEALLSMQSLWQEFAVLIGGMARDVLHDQGQGNRNGQNEYVVAAMLQARLEWMVDPLVSTMPHECLGAEDPVLALALAIILDRISVIGKNVVSVAHNLLSTTLARLKVLSRSPSPILPLSQKLVCALLNKAPMLATAHMNDLEETRMCCALRLLVDAAEIDALPHPSDVMEAFVIALSCGNDRFVATICEVYHELVCNILRRNGGIDGALRQCASEKCARLIGGVSQRWARIHQVHGADADFESEIRNDDDDVLIAMLEAAPDIMGICGVESIVCIARETVGAAFKEGQMLRWAMCVPLIRSLEKGMCAVEIGKEPARTDTAVLWLQGLPLFANELVDPSARASLPVGIRCAIAHLLESMQGYFVINGPPSELFRKSISWLCPFAIEGDRTCANALGNIISACSERTLSEGFVEATFEELKRIYFVHYPPCKPIASSLGAILSLASAEAATAFMIQVVDPLLHVMQEWCSNPGSSSSENTKKSLVLFAGLLPRIGSGHCGNQAHRGALAALAISRASGVFIDVIQKAVSSCDAGLCQTLSTCMLTCMAAASSDEATIAICAVNIAQQASVSLGHACTNGCIRVAASCLDIIGSCFRGAGYLGASEVEDMQLAATKALATLDVALHDSTSPGTIEFESVVRVMGSMMRSVVKYHPDIASRMLPNMLDISMRKLVAQTIDAGKSILDLLQLIVDSLPHTSAASKTTGHQQFQIAARECIFSMGGHLVNSLLVAISGAMPSFMLLHLIQVLHVLRNRCEEGDHFASWIRDAIGLRANTTEKHRQQVYNELMAPKMRSDKQGFKRVVKAFCGGKRKGSFQQTTAVL